jgi:cyclophilin family peptidyl-prolyl cis-trans isomerase
MKKIVLSILICFVAVGMIAAKPQRTKKQRQKMVKIETTLGTIKVKLYDETPLHRDNFLKLVKEEFYEGTLFHRVIRDFMIQAGDPESKTADSLTHLGAGGVGYTVPAEIVFPQLYHKRGALAAARQGDMVNPEKKSSGCQFYIVQGQTFTDEQLDQMEKRIAYQLRMREPFHYTEEQRIAYKTFGGTPHLDGQYTVFGEVVEGFDVLQKISEVKTSRGDRPVEDIRILKVKLCKK